MAADGNVDYEKIMAARKRAWANKEGSFAPGFTGEDKPEQDAGPAEEVPASVAELKEKGNAAYKERDYELAVKCYSEALPEVEQATRGPQREILKSLWNNRAACLLELGEWEKCEQDCTHVLQKFDPGNDKARYRRARARRQQGKLFMAMDDLEVAKKRAPKSKYIKAAIEQLQDDMGVPGMCFTQKEILRAAPEPEQGEEEPPGVERGDTITVHAAGYLQDGGHNFWSTRKKRREDGTGDIVEGEPFTYLAGRGRVIRGWDMGVMNMKVGEIRSLRIPAKEAYKEDGFPQFNIPPNADLVYDIECLKIEPKPPFTEAAVKWCGGPHMLAAIVAFILSVIIAANKEALRSYVPV